MDLNKLEYHKCLLQSICLSLIDLQGICKWSVSKDLHFHQSTIASRFTLCSMKHLWCTYIRFDVSICSFRCRSVISLHHPNLQSYELLIQWRVIFLLETANDEIGLCAFEYCWFKESQQIWPGQISRNFISLHMVKIQWRAIFFLESAFNEIGLCVFTGRYYSLLYWFKESQ